MNVLTFDSRQCERIRRHLDAYLSNELRVETTSEILRHLETCEACTRELETRTQVREFVRRAAANLMPPEELRLSILRRLRETEPSFWSGSRQFNWAVALAVVVAIVLGGLVTHEWVRVVRGRRIVAGALALGVSDHVQCAIKGHNYPQVANPPEVLRQKLGPQYAGLLDVVHQNLPGFEILEAHVCSIPGSSRKYVHFITRGRGTILSVILTKNDGAQLPSGGEFRSAAAGHVNLYQAHQQGMNVAGFESRGYLGFVVSDLDTNTTLQIADQLVPPLNAALQVIN